MSYENEKNIAGETETLSPDDQNVSRLLSNLKRVDAPKDFDFHLKARIANASPARYKPVRFFPVLKYALPLALFLLVGAAFVLTSSYSGWNVPPVASVPDSAPILVTDLEYSIPVNDVPGRLPENVFTAQNPSAVRKFGPLQTKETRLPELKKPNTGVVRGGGFVDTAGNGTAPAILPRFNGSNSNSQRNPVGFDTSVALEVRQVLRNLGIDTSEDSPGTLMVRTVVKDSIGERSGLKVGDFMESIDDKTIQTLYDGSFTVKSIGVRRNGKAIKIDLQTSKP